MASPGPLPVMTARSSATVARSEDSSFAPVQRVSIARASPTGGGAGESCGAGTVEYVPTGVG